MADWWDFGGFSTMGDMYGGTYGDMYDQSGGGSVPSTPAMPSSSGSPFEGMPMWRGLLAPMWGDKVVSPYRDTSDLTPFGGMINTGSSALRSLMGSFAGMSRNQPAPATTDPSRWIPWNMTQHRPSSINPAGIFSQNVNLMEAYQSPGMANAMKQQLGNRMNNRTTGETQQYIQMLLNLLGLQ